ncbi:hypothetical protein BDV93DRAFT_114565 [Ceratobasidium sp. AG-I]|nr:hypothetical protein BDV93DRAFT_114565 [Ceratobasidium sp. AG-I]
MRGPNIVFDYSIKRPYPWRFTTLFILVSSAFVLAGLIYFNLAIVGLTPTTFYSTVFVKSPDPSWIDRLNFRTAANIQSCEPTTLASGGTYRTQNGLFPYTIKSLAGSNSGDMISTLVYEGSVIENCTLDFVTAQGDVALSTGIKLESSLNCTLAGNIELLAGFSTNLFDGLVFEPHTQMAQAVFKLANLFRKDYSDTMSNLFSHKYMLALTPCSFTLYRHPTGGSYSYGNCYNHIPTDDEAGSVVDALDIYVQVLAAAISLDLGVEASPNILTNSTWMRRSFQLNQEMLARFNVSWDNSPHQVERILANLTGYGLPLEPPQPTQFLAQYLCNGMVWKKPSNLVVDVLVATISLFMAYWGILNFVLRYLATMSSPSGNHCICPSCNELPSHASTESDTHALLPLSRGSVYKRGSAWSQPTLASLP